MASAWDDLTRGGWRRVAAATGAREAAATVPRDAGARDQRGGEAVGGGTELPVAGTEGAASPFTGLAPLGWMIGMVGGSDPAEDPSGGPWRDLGGERVPVLIWRRSRQPWQVRTRLRAVTVGGGLVGLDIDLSLASWMEWLALDLRGRLQALAG